MCAGNVCSPLYLFSNKVAFVTSFQKVCRTPTGKLSTVACFKTLEFLAIYFDAKITTSRTSCPDGF